MNRFDEAFRILMDELKDFDDAENYCVLLSQDNSSTDRKNVALVLFKVLLASVGFDFEYKRRKRFTIN